jgi:hypothetical protein
VRITSSAERGRVPLSPGGNGQVTDNPASRAPGGQPHTELLARLRQLAAAVDVLHTLFQANRNQQRQHNGGDVNEELFPAIGSAVSMGACSFGVSTISTASAVSEGWASLWMGSVSGVDLVMVRGWAVS